MRFDEIELETVPPTEPLPAATAIPNELPPATGDAPLLRRLFALLTDLSLFAALALALSPLLPASRAWSTVASLAGFIVVISYYYFVCSWLFWGKTIGGAIFDVRVVPDGREAMSIRDASMRWSAVYLSLATAGIGFLLAALPARRSLPDRLSATKCVG